MPANFGAKITCDPDVLNPPCEEGDPIPLPAPSVSAEWCSGDEQIVVIYQIPGPDNEPCPPVPAPEGGEAFVVGYFDANGAWTSGAPPAGFGPCIENRDFELVRWCAFDAEGQVVAQVIVEYEYDEDTGELANTRVLNPDGTEFTGTYDYLGVCPVTIDPTLLEVPACLTDTTDPSCSGTPVKVIQSVDVTDTGTIVGIVDYKIYNLYTLEEIPTPLLPEQELSYGECKSNPGPWIGSFTGADISAVDVFDAIAIHKPKCCTVQVETTAGTVILPPGSTDYCPNTFNCLVELVSVEIVAGDGCELEDILIFLQRTK